MNLLFRLESLNFRRIDFGKIWKWVLVSYWIRKRSARVVLNFSQKLLEQSESSILIESDRRYLVSDWTQRADWRSFPIEELTFPMWWTWWTIRMNLMNFRWAWNSAWWTWVSDWRTWISDGRTWVSHFSRCSELSLFCLMTVRTISPEEISESERRVTVSVLSTEPSAVKIKRRMLSSSNLQWAEKKNSHVCNSQEMIKEECSCLQISFMSKRRAKSSSNL